MLFYKFVTFNLLIRIFNIDRNISEPILILFNNLFHLKKSLFYNILYKMLKIILNYHLNTIKLSRKSIVIFFDVENF